MSDHPVTPHTASGDLSNPEAVQPQSRRERRQMEEAARAAVEAANPVLESPKPVSAASLFQTIPIQPVEPTVPARPADQVAPTVSAPVVEPSPVAPVAPIVPVVVVAPVVEAAPVAPQTSTGPVPFIEPNPTGSSGPIPFIEKSPSGSTAIITAPDVATLTPIEPATKPKRGLRRTGRAAIVRQPRLRPESNKRKSREGFVPRASRAIRRAAKETWSTTIRGFVVLVIGAFLVTLTLPSTGFNLALPGYAATETGTHQEVTANASNEVASSITLGTFGVNNFGATRFGSGSWSYSVFNSGAIRWPFPYAAPISSGFGARVAPCAACSTYHKGLDFDPPEGSPIYAVADGVVKEVHNDTWGFGRWVVIHHNVKGLEFDSVYAHMERKSVDLKVGDEVKVADYVGRVGNTGTSTGAHLHLEIHENGVPVDPYAWLKKHTK